MKVSTVSALAALGVACAPAAYASTVDASFTQLFAAEGSLSGGRSLASLDFDANILDVIKFSADVNAGTYLSVATVTQKFTFSDEMTLTEAKTASFTHGVTGLGSNYSTGFGAKVSATADIVIAEIDIIDEGAFVSTSSNDSTLSFGQTLTDTDRDALVGAGLGFPIGLSPVVDVTVNLEQRSRQRVTSVSGRLVARNTTTGTMKMQNYDSNSFSSESFNLDLSETGTWEIVSLSSDLFGTFEADFGTSATGTVGGFFGFNCGDVSTDSDNRFGCLGDFGTSITSPAAYILNNSPFAMDYKAVTRSGASFFSDVGPDFLGRISVTADPVVDPGVIPLPAGGWLLLSGLGLMVASRRRKT